MDERVRQHAATLVEWCARIESGDDVILEVGPAAQELAVALGEQLGEIGANYHAVAAFDAVERAYTRASDGEFEADPDYLLELYDRADSVLILKAPTNTAALSDVSGEQRAAYRRARQEVREARLASDWVKTIHPTEAYAQDAGMSLEGYREFAYNAMLRDWAALADEMAQLKSLLDGGDEVEIVRGDERLTLDITNRIAINSAASVAYDSHNLPSGEVFTAPASADGTISFDIPMTIAGRRVRGVTLTLEDGEVIDHHATEGEDVIADVLATDPGARRFGELGIGMNRGIDRPTGAILFDEKMAETIHLALGRAYTDCLPPGEAGNDSAVHEDLIADMSVDSHLAIDGEVVQRNGTFRWEDGFGPA